MARLNQALLHKIAKRLGKDPKYIREQVSRRASREAVASEGALVMWARDLGIGVASALEKLPPHVQQQMSVPRVMQPRPARNSPRRTAGRTRRATRPPGGASKRRLVFISHSSKDKAVATALVDLIRSAFNMESDKILCTSVDGYRLRAGSDLDEELRREVLAAETLVGIVSPTSKKSTYVQMELGARWVTRKHMIPVTAGGVSPGDVRGPVGRLIALDLSSPTNVRQLVSDLGTELGTEAERPEVLDKHVERVVRASRAAGKGERRSG